MKITHLALAFFGVSVCFAQFAVQIHASGPIPAGPLDKGKVVTGHPYSADVVTQSDQTLADGSHITNTQKASVARDSQGRTRYEETMIPPGADAQPMTTIFISDPVQRVNYILSPDHVAHKVPFVKQMSGAAESGSTVQVDGPVRNVQVRQFGIVNSPMMTGKMLLGQPGDSQTAQLGTQIIEGIQADGSRTTSTIPAGQIGNTNPLVITEERWYSQELQVTIMAKHNDPRFGTSSTQLSNIQLAEPPASTFQVPSDYTIEDSRVADQVSLGPAVPLK